MLRRVSGIATGVLLLSVFVETALIASALQQNSGIVSGRVISKDGAPAAGIRVGALAAGTSRTDDSLNNAAMMALAQTDADGRYRLENITPGNYYLVAGPLDAPIYLPGVAAQSGATVLKVTAGAVLEGVDFHLAAPLTLKVSGRVVREGNKAGSQVLLNLLNRSGANFNATIAADGSFEFPAVRPGTYQARVTPGVGALPALTVVVADKDIANLEIPIPLSAVDVAITVNVTIDGGGLLPRFALQLMPNGPLPTNAASTVPFNFSTNGRMLSTFGAKAQLTLPSQTFPQMEYRVRAMPSGNNGLPEGYIVQSMTAGSVDLLTQPIKITAAIPTEIWIKLGVAEPPPWVRVRGRIIGIDATHPAPASIAIQGQMSDALNAGVLADGTFELPMVLPGTYQARLTPSTDQFYRQFIVQREDPTTVEIPLQIPSFKVSGRTADVAPANSFLRATLLPQPVGSANRSSSSPVAADGSFVFPAVQPGTYLATIAICESDFCGSSGGKLIAVNQDIDGLLVSRNDPGLPQVNAVPGGASSLATNAVGGTITLESGVMMPRFRLKFTTNSVTRSVSLDERSFTVMLPPGDHRVSVADLPLGYEVRSIVDGTSDLQIWPLSTAPIPNGAVVTTIPQGLKIVLGVSSPAPWVKFAGKVVGTSAGPVTTVELTGKILVDTLKAPVGPDGTFAFHTVLPDTYTLRLLPGGNASGQTLVVGAAGIDGIEIDTTLHR